MKTKTATLTFIVAFAATITAFAQTNLSFLTSKAALRAYAVDQANISTTYLFAPTEVGNQAATYDYLIPTNHTSADILKGYVNQTFNIIVLDPNDYVTIEGAVYNSDNDQLFYGISSAQSVLSNGVYSLPTISMILELSPFIPVEFTKQIAGAEMIYTDPVTGQTYNEQQLQVYGSKVYFPIDSAGDGYLVVNFTDGTQSNFDLKHGGVKTSGVSISQFVSAATIDNLVTYTNPPQVIDELQSQGGIGENRTYEILAGFGTVCPVGYTCVPISTKFFIWTSEGYVPLGYYYRQSGSQTWQYTPAENGSANIPFSAIGTWYVIPYWDSTQFTEPAPNIWNGTVGVGEG